jgi:hypothetical protein
LNLIGEDDDGAGGFNARLELVLPADGSYVIEATLTARIASQGKARATIA